MSNPVQEYDLDMDVANMCRICLSQTDMSERLCNIFSSAIVDGFLVSLPDVIQYSVDLKVFESDRMPKKICQKCKAQLLNFYLFKQKCKRTEKILQDAFVSAEKQSSCSEEELDSLINSNSNGMIEMFVDEPNYEEEVTDEQTTSNMLTEEVNYQCALCDQIFPYEEELQEHATIHSKLENAAEDDLNLGIIEKVDSHSNEANGLGYNKSLTPVSNDALYSKNGEDQLSNEKEYTTSDIIKDDVEVQSSRSDETYNPQMVQLHCNICGKTVKGRSCYLKHLRIHDANTSVTEFFSYHICKICSIVYLDSSELSEHITASNHEAANDSYENSSLPYVCGICSVEHAKIAHIKQHLLSHLNSFPCPFDGCGCEYTSSARLGIHIANKHIEYESHQCQHCGVDSFTSMAELQQHLRLNCSGKKFPCDHCDKKFLTSRSLAHHLKCLEKKHRCDDCGKAFAQHGELKLHQRMHNGERPFKCTVCGKCYKTASLRTAHMDSHIEGKTFQCHLCGKHLQTRTCYRNHIKRHSEERKHECDVCSKKFYTKYNVKVHKEKVHKLNQQSKADQVLHE